jgi:hypothetical protein
MHHKISGGQFIIKLAPPETDFPATGFSLRIFISDLGSLSLICFGGVPFAGLASRNLDLSTSPKYQCQSLVCNDNYFLQE